MSVELAESGAVEAAHHVLGSADEELVAGQGLRGIDGVDGKFEHAGGVRIDGRDAETREVFDDLEDAVVVVKIEEVEREQDPDGVDAAGGHNPETFVETEAQPADEAAKACEGGVGRGDAQAEEAFARLVIYAVGLSAHCIFLYGDGPAHSVLCAGAPYRLHLKHALVDPLAAALDQDDQQNDGDDAGYNPDNRYIVHVRSPFLVAKVLAKVFHDDDGGRAERHKKERWKDEEDEREDQLDGGLGGLLFNLLAALRAERVGVDAQRFGDAGAELFRLREHADEVAHAFDVGAVGEVLPGVGAGTAGTLLEHDELEFVADVGVGVSSDSSAG